MKNKVVTFLILFMTGNAFSQYPAKTFILVHGAGHGAWSWIKVKPNLESRGFTVIAIELPGTGNNPEALSDHTLEADVNKVMEAAMTTQGRVVLAGHSSGGVVISQAAEWLGSEKVERLIYIDAFLPHNGESVFTLVEKIRQNVRDSVHLKEEGDVPEIFLFSEDRRSVKWNPALTAQLFYHDCTPEDVVFARQNLSWQSVATLATPAILSDKNFGAIRKFYILCTEAKDMDKRLLLSFVPCERVYELASGHSPFFSEPEKLVEIMVSAQ